MWSTLFWKAATERALKSGAQALILLASGDSIFNVINVDWELALGTSLGAIALSYLTSIASAGVDHDGPSLSSAEVLSTSAVAR